MVQEKLNRQSDIVYQIYPSSFKDANGDGIGDLKGITQKLDYIKSLNVDAIWISPFFLSPEGDKGDGGYAVSDYQKVNPRFGSNEDFEELIKKAHEKGLKIYTDFVMCHTSDEHEWFGKSVDWKKNEGFKDRYVWANAKNAEVDANGDPVLDEHGKVKLQYGDKPIVPNNWKSVFEGPSGRKDQSAWEWNDKRQQFYLHHFNVSQPAINANSPEVRKAVIAEMKLLLDKGVDGLRLDALSFANCDPQLRDNPGGDTWDSQHFQHSMCQDSTVEYVAEIRKMLDSYHPPKRALGEAIAGKDGGFNSMPVSATYVDEQYGLHSCYTEPKFWPDPYNGKPSGYPSAGELKGHLHNIENFFPGGAMCNYLSNHDFSRASTRMMPHGCPEELRTTVLKQLMAINLSLPGSVCIYQGEELGLPDARIPEDIPHNKIKDTLDKSCRDRARASMPWDDKQANGGFSTSSEPYLPVPDSYKARAVNLQDGDRLSMLNFTRRLIKERQDNPALSVGSTTILNTPDDIFAFTRQAGEQTILFVSNMSRHTAKFKPADYLDAATLEKLHLQDSEMTIGAYGFTRRGLKTPEKETALTESELANGHKGTKIFAADLLVADVFHHSSQIPQIMEETGWHPARRESIDKDRHDRLLAARNDDPQITIGGSTLLTLDTLKKLNPGNISVDFMGVASDDRFGTFVKDHLKNVGINLLTPEWPEDTGHDSAVSHIIKTGSHDILATYSGDEVPALYKTLASEQNNKLLERSIAHSDWVYLSGSMIEKFGKPFIDEILQHRWNYEKKLVLALPVHANFGSDDAATFRGLVRSANIIVGNDMEFCRIFDINDFKRPANGGGPDVERTDQQMKIVTDKIQESFRERVLQNNGIPCDGGQVAFITRGNRPALLVTENKVVKIPVSQAVDAKNVIGSGDTATAAFLDAEMRGLSHRQSAKYAVAMAAEKVQQEDETPYLRDVDSSRKRVLARFGMENIAKAYYKAPGIGTAQQITVDDSTQTSLPAHRQHQPGVQPQRLC